MHTLHKPDQEEVKDAFAELQVPFHRAAVGEEEAQAVSEAKPVRKYLVQSDAFFSQRINPELRSYHDTNSILCRAAISELIEAYSLGGKSVLSVGSKAGHEEVWFYRAGCPVTLCDIDEHGDLEPILRQLPVGDLAYYICDVRDLPKGRFDVLYLSSFTPDELYKTAVRKRNTNLFRYALRKMRLADWQDYRWPGGVSGFDALVRGLFGLGERSFFRATRRPFVPMTRTISRPY